MDKTKKPAGKDPLDSLPHGYPFRLLDRVISLSGEEAVAEKNVTVNEEFFLGHFKGNPVMPGVMIVEAMAQAAGLVLNYEGGAGAGAYLAKIKDMKFKTPVFPGDRITINVSLDHRFSSMASFRVKAAVGDRVAAEGELVMAGGSEKQGEE